MDKFVSALQRFGIGRLVAILGIGVGVAAAPVPGEELADRAQEEGTESLEELLVNAA